MNNQVLRHDTHCRVCNSQELSSVLKLNPTPLEDQFVKESYKHIEQPTYPLDLALCKECGYLFLPHVVNPEASYADYVYESGVTVGLRSHYDDYAKQVVKDFKVDNGSLVVDLGSNDGSMLASFKKLGMKVLGVEPASGIAALANKNDLPTINNFFTDETVSDILKDHGKANIVTANYMYANIDDVLSFTRAVASLLSDDGVFVVQTGYHPEQMKIKMFDYIYHEHFSYFTVSVLKKMFELCGLEAIHAVKTSPKGGSIRITAQLKGAGRSIAPSIGVLIKEEAESKMHDEKTYNVFSDEIQEAKEKAFTEIKALHDAGKRIVGFGASHSTTTLTYHFELAQFMEYIVDDNKLKHGSYSPGYHLPVYPAEKMYEDKPDYVIVLAWQHSDSILKKHKSVTESGIKFILPLPEFKVIEIL
jgi:hypothetical protein